MTAVVTRELTITYGDLAISTVGAGTGVYTLSATAPAWVVTGGRIAAYGCSNAANNGTFSITGVSGATITTDNSSSLAEGSGGSMAFAFGGQSDFMLTGKYREDRSYLSQTLAFDAVLLGASLTESQFSTLVSQVEQVCRTPRQRIRVTQGAQVLRDLNPTAGATGNTGFNAEPSIAKSAGDWDTGRSRSWSVSLSASLPADLAGQSGRAYSSSALSIEPSGRRIVEITGLYTALTTSEAFARYEASIDAFCATVLTTLGGGGVFEKVSDGATIDDTNKGCEFARRYEQVLYNQSSGTLDDSRFVQSRFTYKRSQVAPGDGDSSARRLEPIGVEFDCWVNSGTTDLEGTWENAIRPYIFSQVQSRFSLGQIALVGTNVNCEAALNRISGSLDLLGVSKEGGGLVEYDEQTTISMDEGKTFVGVWNGDPLAFDVYQSPKTYLRSKTTRSLSIGGGGGGSSGGFRGGAGPALGIPLLVGGSVGFGGGIGQNLAVNLGSPQEFFFGNADRQGGAGAGGGKGGGPVPAAETWINISSSTTTRPVIVGLSSGQIAMTETTTTTVERRANPVAGGGGTPTKSAAG